MHGCMSTVGITWWPKTPKQWALAKRQNELGMGPSVMIEKFAGVGRLVLSEFLDLNHTSKPKVLVSLMIPKFARDASGEGR